MTGSADIEDAMLDLQLDLSHLEHVLEALDDAITEKNQPQNLPGLVRAAQIFTQRALDKADNVEVAARGSRLVRKRRARSADTLDRYSNGVDTPPRLVHSSDE